MTTQEIAHAEIGRLVKNFKEMPSAQRKGMNEMQTRLGYILPLFKALGWDTSNINEVSPEDDLWTESATWSTRSSRGRGD